MSTTSSKRGVLFLIVGPSGAGKDTLMARARTHLGSQYVFPRRTVTRTAHDATEDHVGVTQADFERLNRAGSFALAWEAHDLSYGIPVSIERDLAQGRHVVINVSRTVVDIATRNYNPARVILVTASADVLAQRLASRDRETPDQLGERLRRQIEVPADCTILNDSGLDDAVAALVKALRD